MSEKWLFDILKDGTLVDNQTYTAKGGVWKNTKSSEYLKLDSRKKGGQNQYWNNELAIWHFLNNTQNRLANELNSNSSKNITFINGHEYEHNTDDNLFHLHGSDAQNFTLHTGNLIGFVKEGNYSIRIGSRFGEYFLKYIISDADGFREIENTGGSDQENNYQWLLAYLWNTKLKRAFRLGLPKAYETQTDRLSRPRGKLDVIDYFTNKSSANYLCTYREHSYECAATNLFLEAYKTIKTYDFLQNTRHIYQALLTANQGHRRTRKELLQTRPFRNPYYSDYNVLIELSKQLLKQQSIDFGSANDFSAFLFDVSMLFEYFIRKLISRHGIYLHGKFENRKLIPSGALSNYTRKLEPDLVFEKDEGLYIFDVKYKHFDKKYGVIREDLFQLHTYIGQYSNDREIKGCGFIYPLREINWNNWNNDKLNKDSCIITESISQGGKQIPFHILFLKIPDNSTFTQESMTKACESLLETIDSKVLNS